jgi:hypothetical protein
MSKITYISPLNISGINSITELANSNAFLEHLDPVDYHFLLFSTLYQSGTDFFQLHINNLPPSIIANPFWKNKFIETDKKAYSISLLKAGKLLEANFDFELDKKYNAPQHINLLNYFSSLFYSTKTGIPFVNAEFAESRNFDFLESRFSKELFFVIKNLYSLIQPDSISTITPQYSVLKKDVRRFEDITESTLYQKYADSLNLLSQTDKVDSIKKDIHVSALKLYNKFGKSLDIKAMTFGFLKFNKKIIDLFVNKTASIFGDYLLDSIEKVTTGKKKISYYKVDQAHYMIIWANRIGELMQHTGREGLTKFLDEHKEKNSR